MKSLLCLLLCGIAVLPVSAQKTWVVKAGLGLTSDAEWDSWDDDSPNMGLCGNLGVEKTFPLGMQKKALLSVSANVLITVPAGVECSVYMPVLFGYRFRIGNRCNLIPRIGPYWGTGNDSFEVGPTVGVELENRSFVWEISYGYSFIPYEDFRGKSEASNQRLLLSFGIRF